MSKPNYIKTPKKKNATKRIGMLTAVTINFSRCSLLKLNFLNSKPVWDPFLGAWLSFDWTIVCHFFQAGVFFVAPFLNVYALSLFSRLTHTHTLSASLSFSFGLFWARKTTSFHWSGIHMEYPFIAIFCATLSCGWRLRVCDRLRPKEREIERERGRIQRDLIRNVVDTTTCTLAVPNRRVLPQFTAYHTACVPAWTTFYNICKTTRISQTKHVQW